MPDFDDYERRLRAVEERLQSEAERLHMEAGLRASVDRDLSALTDKTRGIDRIVKAIAETQREHTTRLDRIEATLTRHGDALGTLLGGQQTILELLTRIAPPEGQ